MCNVCIMFILCEISNFSLDSVCFSYMEYDALTSQQIQQYNCYIVIMYNITCTLHVIYT